MVFCAHAGEMEAFIRRVSVHLYPYKTIWVSAVHYLCRSFSHAGSLRFQPTTSSAIHHQWRRCVRCDVYLIPIRELAVCGENAAVCLTTSCCGHLDHHLCAMVDKGDMFYS